MRAPVAFASARRPRRRRLGLLVTLSAAAQLLVCPGLAAATPDTTTDARRDSTRTAAGRLPYPGDPVSEARHVSAEDARLARVQAVGSVAEYDANGFTTPYQVTTGSTSTLVLTARVAPYTLEDLVGLLPEGLVRLRDGSYLLSQDVVVRTGATLRLGRPGGLRLRLASGSQGFTSIVNVGGVLILNGTRPSPMTITSYDPRAHRADRRTDDGRAYLRSIGGRVQVSWTSMSDLGFWSGRTGGFSLKGSARPVDATVSKLRRSLGSATPAGREPDIESQARMFQGEVARASDKGGSGNKSSRVPTFDVDTPAYNFVSGYVRHLSVRRNAFGIFVSSADRFTISDSSFDDNLVDGVVLQRDVTHARVASTQASRNAGDGFSVSRGSTGAALVHIMATGNVRNGVTVSGLPLAEGPSAVGTSVNGYGHNSVVNGRVSGNGRYGVEVIGGTGIKVRGNTFDDNAVGVLVHNGASSVAVLGNDIYNSRKQGVALRDGFSSTRVEGNRVTGGPTAVYVRDGRALVRGNLLFDATAHGVSLVGAVTGTTVTQNRISGRGPSPIDARRAGVLDQERWVNDVSGWRDTKPLTVLLRRVLHPLTLMWLLLAVLLVFTAVRGARARRIKRHPYDDKGPVSDGRVVTSRSRQPAGL